MNDATPIRTATRTGHSACPHDCPSTCALDIEIGADGRIGRIRGAPDNSYTAGVICAKVARYAERLYHPERLLKPLRRKGAKGAGDWQEVSWEDALDAIAEAFVKAEAHHGSEAVWPYFYAGTMGLVQRDSIQRLRHAKRYSGQFESICTNLAWTGYVAGTGKLIGPDPREMAKSDCVVIWGTNAVATQVNVMTHAVRARKERGAKIVAVDVYDTPTMQQADVKIILKPGTDGAFACAVMHVLFRENLADRDYLARYTDDPAGLEAHLRTRTPEWAAGITGLSVPEIEAFARLVGTRKRTFFRLGYGFSRQRNGAVNMHAASCIAAVTGAWQYEGGGAFHSNSGGFGLDQSEIVGLAERDRSIRMLDQCQIGPILTGDVAALRGGPPVTAMLIQNTNPANVAPEQRLVRRGFLRDDLFTVVHEQFMTETAELADIVLPATMFVEHDDIYKGGGQQHITLGPKLVDPPGEARPNLYVIEELAKRLGVADRPGFGLDARTLIDNMMAKSGKPGFDALLADKWVECQAPFEEAHSLNGFNWPNGRFRFKPDWTGTRAPNRPPRSVGILGPHERLPQFPDHVDVIETADADHPFRLATSPARSFLNSSFSRMPGSRKREGRPEVKIHPDDAMALGVGDGDIVTLGNKRGQVRIHARFFGGLRRGVLVAEGIWPNADHLDGEGINVLTGSDPCAPYGGAAFHDNKVWVRKG
ncbi:MAG: molybdopterin oxidoreductase family protein [Pararhizobium sp.]